MSRAYYAVNRSKLLAQQKARDLTRLAEKSEYNRAYQTHHPNPEYHRAWKLRRLYGLTMDDYATLVQQQDGICAICGQPETAKDRAGRVQLRVDHDHVTGRVRGLLCHNCNTVLAYVERASWLHSALAYVATRTT